MGCLPASGSDPLAAHRGPFRYGGPIATVSPRRNGSLTGPTSPGVQTAQLALLVSDFQRLFDDHRFFTPWQLFEQQENDAAFTCLIEPPAFDVRLVAHRRPLCRSDNRQSFDSSGALTKYVIPAAEIRRIRNQLDLVGIDQRRLFPDPADSKRIAALLRLKRAADCFGHRTYMARELSIQFSTQTGKR